MKAPKIEDMDVTHSHKELNSELDPYPTFHSDLLSERHGGDCCPRCGVAIAYGDKVKTLDGKKGTIRTLSPDDVRDPLYHPDCYEERQAEKAGQTSASLDEFL